MRESHRDRASTEIASGSLQITAQIWTGLLSLSNTGPSDDVSVRARVLEDQWKDPLLASVLQDASLFNFSTRAEIFAA